MDGLRLVCCVVFLGLVRIREIETKKSANVCKKHYIKIYSRSFRMCSKWLTRIHDFMAIVTVWKKVLSGEEP